MFRRPYLIMFLSFFLTTWTSRLFASDPPPPSFRENVAPLLPAKCVRCHGEKVAQGRPRSAHARRGPQGRRVGPRRSSPGKPEKSLLYEKVHDGEMPPGKKDRAQRGRGRDDPPLDRRRGAGRPGDGDAEPLSRSTTSSRSCCAAAPSATAGTGRKAASTCARRRRCSAAASRARRSCRASRRRACSSRRSAPARCRRATGSSRRASSRSSRPRLDVARPLDRGRRAGGRRRARRRHDDARPAGDRQGPRLLGVPAAAAGRGPDRAPRRARPQSRSTPSSCRSWRQKGLDALARGRPADACCGGPPST